MEEEMEKLRSEHVIQTDKARGYKTAYEELSTMLGRHTCEVCIA